jgi:hypothetical protein
MIVFIIKIVTNNNAFTTMSLLLRSRIFYWKLTTVTLFKSRNPNHVASCLCFWFLVNIALSLSLAFTFLVCSLYEIDITYVVSTKFPKGKQT